MHGRHVIRVEVGRAGAQRDTRCSQPSLWNQTINEDFSPSRFVAGQKDQCVRFTVVCWEKLDLSYAYYHVCTTLKYSRLRCFYWSAFGGGCRVSIKALKGQTST